MRQVIDYRQQAAKCREIAGHLSLAEPRNELLKMAENWDRLAREREARLADEASPQRRPGRESGSD